MEDSMHTPEDGAAKMPEQFFDLVEHAKKDKKFRGAIIVGLINTVKKQEGNSFELTRHCPFWKMVQHLDKKEYAIMFANMRLLLSEMMDEGTELFGEEEFKNAIQEVSSTFTFVKEIDNRNIEDINAFNAASRDEDVGEGCYQLNLFSEENNGNNPSSGTNKMV